MPSEEDAKPVKKEEEDEFLVNLKKKPNTANKAAKVKKEESKVKKEEADSDYEEPTVKKSSKKVAKKDESDDDFAKPTAKKSSEKSVMVQKKKKKRELQKKKGAKVVAQENGKKKERKVYDLPGQKRDPPEERDPLRIFYETLYKQVPNSEMAAFWMMENGLLSKEVAKKVYEKKLKRSQQQKLSSPMKSVVTIKKHADSVTIKRKTLSSPTVTEKKKTPDSKIASKQSKKWKKENDDDASAEETDDDFVLADSRAKKPRVA
ncbi:hypothetical protein LguiB_020179 [Lonicera macranthoides]